MGALEGWASTSNIWGLSNGVRIQPSHNWIPTESSNE
jgi:hypothetical protein